MLKNENGRLQTSATNAENTKGELRLEMLTFNKNMASLERPRRTPLGKSKEDSGGKPVQGMLTIQRKDSKLQ